MPKLKLGVKVYAKITKNTQKALFLHLCIKSCKPLPLQPLSHAKNTPKKTTKHMPKIRQEYTLLSLRYLQDTHFVKQNTKSC